LRERPTFRPITYTLNELLGTKLRALYQRDKGRDLFDLWYALEECDIQSENVVEICREYLNTNGNKVTRAQFEQNLKTKAKDDGFRTDVDQLLSQTVDWDFDDAFEKVLEHFIHEFPGKPWQGNV
jgi:predicted nucleotidyltransferase component of viral defense system